MSPEWCEIPGCRYHVIIERHRITAKIGYKLGNVISLCPNHHAEADRGIIPAATLQEIVCKRIELNGQATRDSG